MKNEAKGKIYQTGKLPVLMILLMVFRMPSGFSQLQTDSILFNLSQRPKFFFQFDATNSFVSGRGANAIGVKAGLDFAKRIKFGTGFYTVVSDIVESKYVEKYDTFYNAKLQMNYYTTFIDYILYDRGRWQFSLLNQAGIGNSYFWYYPNRDKNKNKKESLSNNLIILYEPAIMGQFKFIKWAGIGFGTGYRIMILNNKDIDHRLSSPVYAIRIKIFMNEIINSIWPNGIFPKKKKKQREAR